MGEIEKQFYQSLYTGTRFHDTACRHGIVVPSSITMEPKEKVQELMMQLDMGDTS